MPGGSGGSARAQLAEQCYVLWATAETGDDTRELVVAICQPAVEKSARVQPAGRGQRALSRCCHKQRLLEVHEALCQAAVVAVHEVNSLNSATCSGPRLRQATACLSSSKRSARQQLRKCRSSTRRAVPTRLEPLLPPATASLSSPRRGLRGGDALPRPADHHLELRLRPAMAGPTNAAFSVPGSTPTAAWSCLGMPGDPLGVPDRCGILELYEAL